jgi:hypothetical protein
LEVLLAVGILADEFLEVEDDGLDVAKFLDEFLVVAAALEGVAGAHELRHAVEDAAVSESLYPYLRFFFETIISLCRSRKITYSKFSCKLQEPTRRLPSPIYYPAPLENSHSAFRIADSISLLFIMDDHFPAGLMGSLLPKSPKKRQNTPYNRGSTSVATGC